MATRLELGDLFHALGKGDPVALPTLQEMGFVAEHFGIEDMDLEYFVEEYAQRGLDAGVSLSSTAFCLQ